MKSYTDISQSKKLAEILPLESADMYYDGFGRLPQGYAYPLIYPNSFEYDKPCWSLAALLGVLPNYEINNFGDSIQLAVKNKALVTDEGETLLDLVVNMIIYLHELNLL